MAKALRWADTDTEGQKLGEKMGLETPIVKTTIMVVDEVFDVSQNKDKGGCKRDLVSV